MKTRGSRTGSPSSLLRLLQVDHEQRRLAIADLDRGEADAGASYIVSNMSAMSARMPSSTASTGSATARRPGSGTSRMVEDGHGGVS